MGSMNSTTVRKCEAHGVLHLWQCGDRFDLDDRAWQQQSANDG